MNKREISSWVQENAEKLLKGNKHGRTTCPVCYGKNTFSISAEERRFVYHCFKASCGISGRTAPKDLSVAEAIARKSSIRHHGQQDQAPITLESFLPLLLEESNDYTAFLRKFPSISLGTMQLYVDPRESRLVFPCYFHGKLVDAVGRAIKGGKPKWKRYGKSRWPFVREASGVYQMDRTSTVQPEQGLRRGISAVVVEDIISALSVPDEYVSIALLGTHDTTEARMVMRQYDRLYVALDPDALGKGAKLAAKMAGTVAKVKLVQIKDDLKYFSQEEIRRMLDG